MGRMSDLDLALKDLRSAAESILSAVKAIEAIYSAAAPTSAPMQNMSPAAGQDTVPSSGERAGNVENGEEKQVSIDEVRTVLTALSNDGKKSAVKKLLAKYGSSRLSEIDPKNYKDLLKDAEEVKNAG